MAQARSSLGLALRAGARLSLPRDDLQSHLEPRLLVARQPHRTRSAPPQRAPPGGPPPAPRTGSAAPERLQRAVPPEDELALDGGESGVRHRSDWVGRSRGKSFS